MPLYRFFTDLPACLPLALLTRLSCRRSFPFGTICSFSKLASPIVRRRTDRTRLDRAGSNPSENI